MEKMVRFLDDADLVEQDRDSLRRTLYGANYEDTPVSFPFENKPLLNWNDGCPTSPLDDSEGSQSELDVDISRRCGNNPPHYTLPYAASVSAASHHGGHFDAPRFALPSLMKPEDLKALVSSVPPAVGVPNIANTAAFGGPNSSGCVMPAHANEASATPINVASAYYHPTTMPDGNVYLVNMPVPPQGHSAHHAAVQQQQHQQASQHPASVTPTQPYQFVLPASNLIFPQTIYYQHMQYAQAAQLAAAAQLSPNQLASIMKSNAAVAAVANSRHHLQQQQQQQQFTPHHQWTNSVEPVVNGSLDTPLPPAPPVSIPSRDTNVEERPTSPQIVINESHILEAQKRVAAVARMQNDQQHSRGATPPPRSDQGCPMPVVVNQPLSVINNQTALPAPSEEPITPIEQDEAVIVPESHVPDTDSSEHVPGSDKIVDQLSHDVSRVDLNLNSHVTVSVDAVTPAVAPTVVALEDAGDLSLEGTPSVVSEANLPAAHAPTPEKESSTRPSATTSRATGARGAPAPSNAAPKSWASLFSNSQAAKQAKMYYSSTEEQMLAMQNSIQDVQGREQPAFDHQSSQRPQKASGLHQKNGSIQSNVNGGGSGTACSQSPVIPLEPGEIRIVPAAEDPLAKKMGDCLFAAQSRLLHKGVPFTLRGLVNQGNWCYVNGSLQALLACPPFFNLLRELLYVRQQGQTHQNFHPKMRNAAHNNYSHAHITSTPVLDAMIQFIGEFSFDKMRIGKNKTNSAGKQFEPTYVYRMLNRLKSDLTFKGRQEDAEEFLLAVLNHMHDEMVACLQISQPNATKYSTSGQLSPHPQTGALSPRGSTSVAASDYSTKNAFAAFTNSTTTSTAVAHQPDASMMNGGGLPAPPGVPLEIVAGGGGGVDGGSAIDDEWQQVGPGRKVALTRQTAIGDSPLADIFVGHMRYSVQAVGHKESVTMQPFFTLPLDIQADSIHDIVQALQQAMSKEIVKGYNAAKSKTEVDATRRASFEKLPLVLILQLKYFVFEVDGGVKKIHKKMAYHIDLQLDTNLLSHTAQKRYVGNQRDYKLFAVVYHHGERAEGGHYTADIFHGGAWIQVDDVKVTSITIQHVLESQPNRVPYLLFYRRVDAMSNPVTYGGN